MADILCFIKLRTPIFNPDGGGEVDAILCNPASSVDGVPVFGTSSTMLNTGTSFIEIDSSISGIKLTINVTDISVVYYDTTAGSLRTALKDSNYVEQGFLDLAT